MSTGTMSQLGISTANPVDAAYEFVSESVKARQSVLDASGQRGSRRRRISRTVGGNIEVGGDLVFQPGPLDLRALLPWCGLTESGSGPYTYVTADTLSTRYVTIDRIAKVFTYDGCVVSRMTIAASAGELVNMTLSIAGKSETIGNAGTFPSLAANSEQPFMFGDATLTLSGGAFVFRSFSLTIDNAVQVEHNNSRTATRLTPQDRTITLELSSPYTSSEQAAHVMRDADNSTTATLTLTNGGQSLAIAMTALARDLDSPVVSGKSEIMLPHRFHVMAESDGDPELTMTLDTTA